jgi:hypothetical protein
MTLFYIYLLITLSIFLVGGYFQVDEEFLIFIAAVWPVLIVLSPLCGLYKVGEYFGQRR